MEAPEYLYTTEAFEIVVDADGFISRFRDFERFNAYCRECPQYNRNWACPPFTTDIDNKLSQYKSLLFHTTKIIPSRADIPLSESRKLIRPVRIELERKFSTLEEACGGLFMGFAGSCPYCPENSCARLRSEPCRFPRLCHPSLEAYGFDLCRAVSEIFGFEILWSRNDKVPEYLTLVCGLFHN